MKRSKKKNSQLIIRINDEDRRTFVELCDELDTSAAREVRRFIKGFVAKYEQEQNENSKKLE
ncbi:hypothetical protein [Planctobacterium marinum]|uniref:Uncharacterized protein n=1 Tax=Planctobacterium marinum TaxID=1631968 RepID=A0AA48KS63_9ALTE|nr:hypothetical protein MACH26_38040 [Planctobacterium marinum]